MLQSHPQPACAAYPNGTSLPLFAEGGTRVLVKDSSKALADRRPEEPTLAILNENKNHKKNQGKKLRQQDC